MADEAKQLGLHFDQLSQSEWYVWMDNHVLGMDEFLHRKHLKKNGLTAPEAVIEGVSQLPERQEILVDFDDTLWLTNSTEQFIELAARSVVVAIVLQIMDMLKPWRWLHGSKGKHYRDLYRVRCGLWLNPMAKRQWQQQAKSLVDQYLNQPLYQTLMRHKGKVFVVSYGFDFVLQPILDEINLGSNLLVCSNLTTAAQLRMSGKAAAASALIGSKRVTHGACVTDSKMDKDLLLQCQDAWLCQWPESVEIRAGMSPMLPFVYLKKVKRPTESYFTRAILGHDYLTLILAFALINPYPLYTAVALFGFVIAYFTAYEIGYFENDNLGAKLEEKPKISKEFSLFGQGFRPSFAWFFTLLLTAPPAWLAAQGPSFIPGYFQLEGAAAFGAVYLVFISFVLAVRAVFAWFNRLTEKGRLIPMLLLQLGRNGGYLLIFATSTVGALFIVTCTLSKWIPYVAYRFGADRKGMPEHLINGLMFAVLVSLLWGQGTLTLAELTSVPSLVILAYLGLRALIQLWKYKHYFQLLVPRR